MLRSLFARLTPAPARGAALFDVATALARDPALHAEGGVADTLDGRFAALATMVAMVLVRLERAEPGAKALSVGLTERFVEAMDAEHRQLGISDPTLGKTVCKLVGSLARRVELWREATSGKTSWDAATATSLSLSDSKSLNGRLRSIWERLDRASVQDLAAGSLP